MCFFNHYSLFRGWFLYENVKYGCTWSFYEGVLTELCLFISHFYTTPRACLHNKVVTQYHFNLRRNSGLVPWSEHHDWNWDLCLVPSSCIQTHFSTKNQRRDISQMKLGHVTEFVPILFWDSVIVNYTKNCNFLRKIKRYFLDVFL